MSLSCTTVVWRGLTLSSVQGESFGVRSVQGWDELPSARLNSSERPQTHGRFDSDVWSDERIVTVGGQILSADRDALLHELASVMTWPSTSSPAEELTITRAGRTLTAFARLTAFRTPTDLDWAMGLVPFAIEWRCPDPLRYGEVQTAATTFPVRTGGLRFPLYSDGAGTNVGALDYGDVSQTGRLVLSNGGTADSWPQFVVEGPVGSSGFELITVGTGARVTYSGAVPAGSQLVLDSATGTAVIDGVADRGGRLTHRDWTPVPAGGSVEFAFVPLGATSSAVLHATVRPAFW